MVEITSSREPIPVNMSHCHILGQLWLFHREDAEKDEGWRDFFAWADIGLPLAYMISQELALPSPDTNEYIEETWRVFCEMISIDPNRGYEDLQECFGVSPNPSLEEE